MSVYRQVQANLLAPVSAFMRPSRGATPAVLLEFVEGGRQYAPYSYDCIDPRATVAHVRGVTTLQNGSVVQETRLPFVSVLGDLLVQYQVPRLEELPGFYGGWVGYLGYEAVTCLMETFITEPTLQHYHGAGSPAGAGGGSGGYGYAAAMLMVPATIPASCAFIRPVATSPNAIVFGTDRLTIPQEARAGIVLDFIGVVLITSAVFLLGRILIS